jgi:hypothetical protein
MLKDRLIAAALKGAGVHGCPLRDDAAMMMQLGDSTGVLRTNEKRLLVGGRSG